MCNPHFFITHKTARTYNYNYTPENSHKSINAEQEIGHVTH